MIDEREIKPNIPVKIPSKDGCEANITDVPFPVPFPKGLVYAPPARGTWTIAHSPMLIPGCHEIYVCCPCCLHGVVLSADEIPDGGNSRFSMVTLTNENVLKGDLEEMMIEGVSEVLKGLPEMPRLVECFTSCVQHFLNIDLKVVYRALRERFPGMDFIDGYMIPTLARKLTPDMLGRRQLLRAASMKRAGKDETLREKRDRAVSLIVNYYPLDPDSELKELFEKEDYEVRDFASCKTYEDYLALADSECALVFVSASLPAAKDFQKQTGMDYLYLPYSYSFEELRREYQTLTDRFGLNMPDPEEYERRITARAREVSELYNGTPLVLDYTASPRILQMALFLLENGFQVKAVYTDAFSPEEEEVYNVLREKYPQLLIRPTQHFKMRLLPRDEGKKEKLIAVGQKAAYFTGTDHFVNMIENGAVLKGDSQPVQLFGYSGILHFLDLLEEAFLRKSDVKSVIEVKAFGCSGRIGGEA